MTGVIGCSETLVERERFAVKFPFGRILRKGISKGRIIGRGKNVVMFLTTFEGRGLSAKDKFHFVVSIVCR